MNKNYLEKLLNIKTNGHQTDYNECSHYNKYEPTPYTALETLFKTFNINENDKIVDFGCGKGRVSFYANYFYKTRGTGIEMNHHYFDECIKNKESFLTANKADDEDINFFNCLAQEYEIQNDDNIFYFFNPFSIQIFMNILENIIASLKKCKRKISIILYYPADEYIFFIETYTSFILSHEIKLPQYEYDLRERFLIYQFNYN
ncbi:SAM-dependent methyltransferase [uncultured Clostridium sp.]|uniref:SAM-dependent methyltransferase n=1 Tax=uncultured Clostridium sp. TaxID=59620 RepID=UPI0025CD7E91|nr:SAM-dependent methyltransferase [uncultured Clostridium sp.]